MNYNKYNPTNELLDSFASNSFIPLILQPTRISSYSSNTPIDLDIISVNLNTTISDHLPQFAKIPIMFGNTTRNKHNIYKKDWSKFDRENFIIHYFSIA